MFASRFIKFSIVSFAVVGIILFFGDRKWFPEFYNPKFMAWISFASAIILVSPQMIFKSNDAKRQKYLKNLQLAMAISLILNGLGGLGFFQLYKYGFEFDKMTHFTVSFVLIITLSKFLEVWYNFSFKKSLAISIILIATIGILWEFLEFASDVIFKTQTLGKYGKEISKDTVLDVILNFIGIILATNLLLRSKTSK